MKDNVLKTTVKNDRCINCGICKVVCPTNAICLKLNKYNEKKPIIDKDKCVNCGLCSKYCPNTENKITQEIEKLSNYKEPHTFGLQNSTYYVAWTPDKSQRQKCCSGGAVTTLACHLLQNKLIDGMVHVERLWGHRGDLHYGARLSFSVDEICENVSSAYQPIDFSEVIPKLENGKTYFITGTPCVIRGIKKLFEENNKYKDINIMTCALVCSHNTNAQFIDFLTEINELCDKEEWKVNIRYKDDEIIDANNFKNYIYTKEKVLLNKNRFESKWTHIWRNYYFAMGACLKCADFWGYEADISIKDAWGEWAKDPLGKSIVVIRNKNLEKEFLNSGLVFEKLDYETMKEHQITTAKYKQAQASNKMNKSILSKVNRKNMLFKYTLISKTSKFLYKNFGYKITKMFMPIIEFIATRGGKL